MQRSENFRGSMAVAPRRRGQPVAGEVLERIYDLVDRGWPPPQVYDRLCAEFDPDVVPDPRTVRSHIKRYRAQRGDGVAPVGLRAPHGPRSRWRRPEPGAGPEREREPTPWTPAAPGDADVRGALAVLAAALVQGHPWPDAATVQWWEWVARQAPDLPAADVPTLAGRWRRRVARGEPVRDLTLFLACAPWRGERAFDRYLAALVATGEPLYPWWGAFPEVAGAWVGRMAAAMEGLLRAAWRAHAARGDLTDLATQVSALVPTHPDPAADRGRDTDPTAVAEVVEAAEKATKAAAEIAAGMAWWGERVCPWLAQLHRRLVVLATSVMPVRRAAWADGDALDPPVTQEADGTGDWLWHRLLEHEVEVLINVVCATRNWMASGLPPTRPVGETWGHTLALEPEPGTEPGTETGTAPGDQGTWADWRSRRALIRSLIALQPLLPPEPPEPAFQPAATAAGAGAAPVGDGHRAVVAERDHGG